MKKVTLLAPLLVLMLVIGCNNQGGGSTEKSGDAESEKEVVIPVQVARPEVGAIADYFNTTTRIEAENRVDLVAEAVAECTEVRVDEGDRVTKGDVLAVLDKDEPAAALKQAEVTMRQRKAEYDRARKGFGDRVDYDENEYPLYITEADLDAARYAYEQANANVEVQRIQLAKRTITAPIDGIITRKNIQVGQLVSSGTPVFTIVDPSSFMLTINPPEKELPRLQVGQVAEVSIDALGGQTVAASVRQINPAVDPVSGTVEVKLDFDESTRIKLHDSGFVRVNLVMETHENAILIPKDAVVEENARKYVFVVEPVSDTPGQTTAADGTDEGVAEAAATDAGTTETAPAYRALRREVHTGLEDSARVEIIEGITQDSLVVTLGQHTLKPDSLVTLTNIDAALTGNIDMSADAALSAADAERQKAETANSDEQ